MNNNHLVPESPHQQSVEETHSTVKNENPVNKEYPKNKLEKIET